MYCPLCCIEMVPQKDFINMKECPNCGYKGNPVSLEWYNKFGNKEITGGES